jgi:predicted glycoside hydrolase/deacetylase ChbG (UPF0249 family)
VLEKLPLIKRMPAAPADATDDLRRIWLCADDYGIAPGVNAAIRDLIERGRINATTVMMVAPSFHRSDAMALALLNAEGPRAAIGLHLTLTAPFRPLTKNYGPLRNGAFLSVGRTLLAALAGQFDPDGLREEIASQLRMFTHTFGRPPDFVDGHQHVHLFPQISETVLACVRDLAPGAWVRQCGRIGPLGRRLSNRKGILLDVLSRRFRRRAAAAGLRTNAAFAGAYDYHRKADFGALFTEFLADLPEGSLVMCHPGFVDAELERLDPLTTLREREYAFFSDVSFPAVLARHGVALA